MNPSIFVAVPVAADGEHIETVTIRYDDFVAKLLKPETPDQQIKHIALGICSESGEIADEIKKEYIYGNGRNIDALAKEIGDLEFYLQALYNHYEIDRASVLQLNAIKLAQRYAKMRFSKEEAQEKKDATKCVNDGNSSTS
jgi:NTP pyrophosphatase (non-canonical NTP hydrolase)